MVILTRCELNNAASNIRIEYSTMKIMSFKTYRARAYNNRQTPSTTSAKRQVLIGLLNIMGVRCFKLPLFLLQQTLNSD
jgi:hypothetical protein